MEDRIQKLTRALRQEQTLASLRQDMTMYLFVRIGPNGLIPILCQTAEKWRLLRETEPTKLTYSLKMALFKQLLISLHEGLTTTAKDKQAMDKAQATGWLDEYKHWRMLKWNPQQQKLEVDVNLRTVSTEDMLGQVTCVCVCPRNLESHNPVESEGSQSTRRLGLLEVRPA